MKPSLDARVCVIGAGPSGITAAKNLMQVGLNNIVVYEKGDQVGGNWVYSPRVAHSSVYETTHIISSKALSQYDDYSMPDDYPDYPSHKQLLRYFQGYADHFGVTPLIRFNTEVKRVEKAPGETWRVTLADGTSETFDHLLVCNGHHWNPRLPDYPGEFTGEFIHSKAFKSGLIYRDQRVLVIGGGNSAADIVVDASRVAAFAAISMRRGYYIIPKHIMGVPSDVLNSHIKWLPLAVRRQLLRLALFVAVGDYRWYGLEKPNHPLLKSHLVPNNDLLYGLRHGRIHPRRDIARFDGKTVHFVDGRAEEYDVVIAATGFKITFPFFDEAFINFEAGAVPLWKRVMHPDHPTLYFIGLVQPLGCIWPLSDVQSKWVANTIIGNYAPPADMRGQIARQVARQARDFLNTPRHSIEVEYWPHRQEIEREIPHNAPKWGERAAVPG
jgi:hypothetical protein